MKTIIYAHPWNKSYNHAIFKSITEVLKTTEEPFQVIDLYEDKFNPVYSAEELRLYSKGETNYPLVKEYQNKLKDSSELIFIFPIWWYSMPSILKGFLDKVFLPKFAYLEDANGNWQGLLTNIEKVSVITTATYTKEELIKNDDVIQGVFMNSTLNGVGISKENMKWIHFGRVNRTTNERREKFLKLVPSLIN